jgi:bifunctional UDP-N-acetylglucosamine pyrophosphorylase / glucosamine-1-phosphate N-acetyltransferase
MMNTQPCSENSANPTPVHFGIAILAAGKGTRLKSRHPKVLHQIAGKPLLAHVVAAAIKVVPPVSIFAIIGHEADLVREALKSTGINFVLQREQRGTGHALMEAREALRGFTHILVLSGDVPLIRPETIQQVRDFHVANRAAMTILTAEPPDPTGYGRVFRKYKANSARSTPASMPSPSRLSSLTSTSSTRRISPVSITSPTWRRS